MNPRFRLQGFDAAFAQRVEDCVAAIESRTDAEVVVVAAARSGRYDDLRYLVASILAFASLAILIEIPAHVPPIWVMVDLVVTWFVVAWITDADPILARLLSTKRKVSSVQEAAAAEFHVEAVHSAPNRMGVLVYLSALERMVEVVPDAGIEEKVPTGAWTPVLAALSADDADAFVKGLETIGEVLATHAPRTGDKLFDLPNAPRIRT